MGVDTTGYIKGYVSADEIVNFIRQKYDTNVVNNVTCKKYGALTGLDFKFVMQPNHENDKEWAITSGFIDFEYNGNMRGLFYGYQNINPYENLEWYKENYPEPKYSYIPDMIKSERVSLSLGKDDDAIKIINDILSYFGGWIDVDDCDDIPYVPIECNSNNKIEPLKYITMEDVYKAFGTRNLVIKS